MHTHAI